MLEDIKLDERQYEIKRHIHRIDQVAIAKEATWGIGNLQEWAPLALRQKFERQQEKLAKAIEQQDLNLVAHLAEGMVKGWQALENNAVSENRPRMAPECLEISLPSGGTLRIAKSITEARMALETGVYVWSLEEVARIIDKEYILVNKIKEIIPDSEVREIQTKVSEFDWVNGDEMAF